MSSNGLLVSRTCARHFKEQYKLDLSLLHYRFNRRLDTAEILLNDFMKRSSNPPTTAREFHELDGWLSDLWQFWCRYCRFIVFASCRGCYTAGGTQHVASHASEGEVSYISINQKKGIPPRVVGSNVIYRLEPTWGHVAKLLDVIQALSPPNRATLLAGFGTVPAIEHIRIIRNAVAHRNSQTMADMKAFQPLYVATQLRHPLQALFWIDATTGRSLIHSRISDMRVAARNTIV